MKRLTSILLLSFFLSALMGVQAQDEKTEDEGYQFELIKEIPATPVKDQYRSGTCWSFSAISFLESELLRMDKGEYDLSEMWIVRNAYSEKAEKYVRMHGKINFSGGGAFHDVFNMIGTYGIVPEDVYDGQVINQDNHVHSEMDHVFNEYIDAVTKNKNRKLSTAWKPGFESLLDVYLGEKPEKFSYQGKEYDPKSYAASLGLDMNDYITLTSFTHHPFYEPFIFEVPDNWAWGEVYNLPLDEMMKIIDNAIDKGYSVAWASDVSEKGFSHRNGVAIVPIENKEDLTDAEIEKWEKMTKKEKQKLLFSFEEPGKEKEIDQQMRQEAFDNYETTDDHGMHIIGISKDQNGTKYYRIKNSWADNSNEFGGYFHASVPFVRYKTMNVVVHKDAIPKGIREKLKL